MPVGYTPIRQWMGVNLTENPRYIADNELAWAQNTFPKIPGEINPRTRCRQVTSGVLAATGTNGRLELMNGCTLYPFIDKTGAEYILIWLSMVSLPDSSNDNKTISRFRLTNVGSTFAAYVERPDVVSNDVPLPVGQVPRPGSLVYNNKLFIFPGHTWSGLVLDADNYKKGSGGIPKFTELGTTWTSFTGATADRPKFAAGCVYRDVFCLTGLPPPYESLVFFTQGIDSGGNAQEAWYSLLSSAKAAGVGFGDGDRLINIVTTPILGGSAAVEPYVIAFKRRSVWLLQGDVPTTTDDGTIIVTPVMRTEGLVSSHAVCTTPYGIIWCSGENVWLMPPGQKPVAIGNKIKGYLRTLPQNNINDWSLAYQGDTLYLNVPSPRAIITGQSSDVNSYAYLPTEQWWCDLRNLDEPKWWGPMDVKATHMAGVMGVNGARQMLGIQPWEATNPAFGFKLFDLNDAMDVPVSGTDMIDYGFEMGDRGIVVNADGTVGLGRLQQVVRTKEFDFGDPSLQKILDAVEVNAKWSPALGAGDTLTQPFTVYPILDGGASYAKADTYGAIAPVAGTVGASQTGFQLDVDALDSTVPLFDRFVPLVMFPPSATRLLFRTLQLEFQSRAGFPASVTSFLDYVRRRFSIQSIVARVRPIGRRPGGTL